MRKRPTYNKCSIKISSTNCYLIRVKANPVSQFRLPLRNTQTGWLTHGNGFLVVLETPSPGSKCCLIWVLVRPRSLSLSLIKPPVLPDQNHALMTSFNLNDLLKAVSKDSHSGLQLQHKNFRGTSSRQQHQHRENGHQYNIY